jgi:GNAT superfamily N-acetyltransferase
MNSPLKIRPALPADAHAISELIHGFAHFFTVAADGRGAEIFFQSISTTAIEGYLTSPRFHYLAGFIDQRLAGVVAVRNGKHLYHLFIAPEFHGQGLSRELWLTAKSAAIAAGNQEGFTVNASLNAVPVYEHFGFIATSAKAETHGVAYIPMTLRLESAGRSNPSDV